MLAEQRCRMAAFGRPFCLALPLGGGERLHSICLVDWSWDELGRGSLEMGTLLLIVRPAGRALRKRHRFRAPSSVSFRETTTMSVAFSTMLRVTAVPEPSKIPGFLGIYCCGQTLFRGA
jgi:hypothetical protein